MNLFLGAAIYVILWWLAFLIMLPIGVRNLDEAGEASPPGVERAAPARPRLWLKALWAAALAGALWLGVYAAMQFDLFDVRGSSGAP